jgi:hypothetical protein
MVGRILGQTYGKMISLGKLHEALHKLGTSAVALEVMIQLDDESCDVRKTLFERLPPVDQVIHQIIAENDGCHSIEKKLIGGWQENSHRRQRRCWLEVVVGGSGSHQTLASTGKQANFDCGVGIHRHP